MFSVIDTDQSGVPGGSRRPWSDAAADGATGPALRHRAASFAGPAVPRWVAVVRHFTARVLDAWQLPADDVDSALLVVGELVANAAEHGRADLRVELRLTGRDLRITVADSGAEGDRPGPRAGGDERGRGLGIVRFLTERLDTSAGAESTVVTAHLATATAS